MAKSCGSDTPRAGVKFLRNKFLRGDGGKSAGLTEEITYKP